MKSLLASGLQHEVKDKEKYSDITLDLQYAYKVSHNASGMQN